MSNLEPTIAETPKEGLSDDAIQALSCFNKTDRLCVVLQDEPCFKTRFVGIMLCDGEKTFLPADKKRRDAIEKLNEIYIREMKNSGRDYIV